MTQGGDNSRQECWQRFLEAAEDARRGHYARGRALIERVRAASGDYEAETARRELRAFVGLSDERLERMNHYIAPACEAD